MSVRERHLRFIYPRQACPITLAPRSKARVPGARPARDGGRVTVAQPGKATYTCKQRQYQSCGTHCRSGSALGGGPHRQSLCYGQFCFSTVATGRPEADAPAHSAGSAVVWQRRPACHGRTAARGGRARRRTGLARHGLQHAAPIQGGGPAAGNRHWRPARLFRYQHIQPQSFFRRGTRPPGRHSRRHDPGRRPAGTAGGSEDFAY